MEACGMSFIKYLLFIFNLIFAISGLTILIVGSVVIANFGEIKQFLNSDVTGPPVVLIIAGLLIFVIAFLGCCGAIKENYFMLITFAVLLFVIFIVEIAVGIAAAVAKDDFSVAMRASLKKSMNNYTNIKTDQESWDSMQRSLKCCGVDNPRGWTKVVGDNKVPVSCCVNGQPTEGGPTSSPNSPPVCEFSNQENLVYQTGCYDKIKMKVKDNILVIMGVGIGIAFIEIAGIVLACCLASGVKKEQEVKNDD